MIGANGSFHQFHRKMKGRKEERKEEREVAIDGVAVVDLLISSHGAGIFIRIFEGWIWDGSRMNGSGMEGSEEDVSETDG